MTSVAVAAQHLIKPHGGQLIDRSGYRPDDVEAGDVLRLARAVDERPAVGRDEVLRGDRAHAVT